MHDSHSPVVDAFEIISSLVSCQVQTFFRFDQEEANYSMAMKHIDLYLSTHINILSKQLSSSHIMTVISIGGVGLLLTPEKRCLMSCIKGTSKMILFKIINFLIMWDMLVVSYHMMV